MRISILQPDATAMLDSALAARDRWQVIDRLAGLELGGAVNPARHREMAQSGNEILQHLATHGSTGTPAVAGDDLVQASESWLAVTATSERQLLSMSQPDAAGDLRVASRYIGETEKNLNTAFEPAQRVSVALLLDDADTLFGRGSDAKDGDD